MLKFQNNNTTLIATFEDFILTVYVVIDDLYHQFAPPEVIFRRHVLDAKLSDPEIITISICGELAGIDSENAWFSFVKKNYHHLFPNLCSRSRFNRTRRALLKTTELLRQKMISVFSIPFSQYFVIDSFPLAVCKFGRARYCRSFRGYGADYGKCLSKKETYFGYKVHVMITLEGYITTFEITPASTDDREGLKDIMDGKSGLVVLGDKGYVGEVPGKGNVRSGNLPYGTQTFKQQNELAEISASIDLPTTKACRNCIFPAKRTVTCRKSPGQKLPGFVYQTCQQNFGI